MAGFNKAWLAVSSARNGEAVSNRLRPLLEAVYQQVLAEPIDSATLKQSLIARMADMKTTKHASWQVSVLEADYERAQSVAARCL